MAILLPDKPKTLDARSLEDVIFESLKKLDDEYYVFHSFSITNVSKDILYESETDFIIFNQNKGILCIEAKAGEIKFAKGRWKYQSGREMSHDGPYNQAAMNKWKIKKYIENSNFKGIANKCKILHAVWFPSITKKYLNNINLPSESDKNITLTQSDLDNPSKKIESIFKINIPNRMKTNLTKEDSFRLINFVLCPSFNLFPSIKSKGNLKEIIFNRLLKEQSNVLNYLVDQKTALINGAAGTGKTMIAIEKAKRNSSEGYNVLFLCYNKKLKEYLEQNYVFDNVSYYTIDGLACKYSNSSQPNYDILESELIGMAIKNTFPYDHIIIDEGQDFGKENIEESNIISILKDIITEKKDGTFYIFYDKLQMVQSKKLPNYILDADCKLTLYKNCRNTIKIAETSMSTLEKKQLLMAEFSIHGDNPNIHFIKDINKLNEYIKEILKKISSDDIIILTCKTEKRSDFDNKIEINSKYQFTTCRKFKGLEADTVIMVDVDKDTFLEDSLIFYVGSSRAKTNLHIISSISEEEARDILNKKFDIIYKRKNPYKRLAAAIGAIANIDK